MKRAGKILALACISMVLLLTAAYAETIYDAYVGGEKLNSWDNSYDVIGDPSVFDISKVEVSTNETGYVFDIYTAFVSNIGIAGIELGDLFLSTDGWNPYGAYPYRQDTADNGETWEYVLVLDNHSGADDDDRTWSLYEVNGDSIILSDDVMGTYNTDTNAYRRNQEVQYDTANQTALASGSWDLTTDFLRFTIAYGVVEEYLTLLNGATEYGFHWTMTCGNDVIEGAYAPVPEPATMFLLGSGLLGLGALRRKKRTV